MPTLWAEYSRSLPAYICRGDFLFGIKIRYSFILFVFVSVISFDYDLLISAFSCMLIHEMGHMVCATLIGYKICYLEATADGLSIVTEKAEHSCHSVMICAAGPLANLLCSLLCIFWGGSLKSFFVLINLSLGLFNLFPVSFLDGGKILISILSEYLHPKTVYRIKSLVDSLLLFALWCVGIYVFLFANSHSISLFLSVYGLINMSFE